MTDRSGVNRVDSVAQRSLAASARPSGSLGTRPKRQEIYPDSVDEDDVITFAYNRQSQVTQITDQNGTVHALDYDLLGRQTQDRVTTLGTGVDSAVKRIAATYEVRGMREHLTSYDHATVGSGSVVNDVLFAYNDFGQLTRDYQAHGGAVNTSTSPQVQYAYANGAANTVRPTGVTYPDGRALEYGYGTADGLDDASSRVAEIVDDDDTHLADYQYLGSRTFVECDHPEPQVRWTLADLAGSNDPDTGDIYSGLDRFGRVKDNRWYDDGSSADVDRIQYGYDRSGNRLWRENTVARSLSKEFDELYGNDLIHRLKDLQRGTLNTGHSALDSTTFAECWSLDPTGNWKKYLEDTNGDGTWNLNQSRTSNDVNEITDITESAGPSWIAPAYNRAGNMTTLPRPSDPTASYAGVYDAWNRLVKLSAGANTVSEYAYDGAKRRVVQKSYTSGTLSETRHLYYTQPSQWQVVEERVGTSTAADRQSVWGLRYIDDCILRDRTVTDPLDERLYALQDANWNVTTLVDTAGDAQERYAYTAYGQPTFLTGSFGSRSSSSYGWETLYAGYRWETGTGVFHVRNRVYHPLLGTWVQRDPVRRTREANLYEYCSSRPAIAVDPTGEFIWIVIAGGILILGWPNTAGAPGPGDFILPGNPLSIGEGLQYLCPGGVVKKLISQGCTQAMTRACQLTVACGCTLSMAGDITDTSQQNTTKCCVYRCHTADGLPGSGFVIEIPQDTRVPCDRVFFKNVPPDALPNPLEDVPFDVPIRFECRFMGEAPPPCGIAPF